ASKHFIDGDGSFYLGDITMAGVKVASVHFCKECGKKHAPRCDKCGSTRDLRSYHGPCGSCAFGKKATMEKVSTLSFLDELDKISFDVGGYLRNAGSRVSKWALNHAEGIGDNVGNAAVAFATPRESLKKGWDATWTPGGKPLHPIYKGLMGYSLLTGLRDVAYKNDPSGRGHSRLRRATRFLGDQAGGIMAAPFGLTGGIFGSVVGGKAGDMMGSAIDKLRGYRPNQPAHLPPRPQGLQE